MGQVLTVLGFITSVLPPLLQAAGTLALPPLAQKILAIAGIIVFLSGVLKQAIQQWQAAEHTQAQAMAQLTRPGLK
jgi:hypothetical protein